MSPSSQWPPPAGSVLLSGAGGWSRAFTRPDAIFTSRSGSCRLEGSGGEGRVWSGDPFRELALVLSRRPEWTAAGYWSYDIRLGLERTRISDPPRSSLPDCWVGLYPSVLPPPELREPSFPARVLPVEGLEEGREPFQEGVRRIREYIAAGDCYQVNLSRRFTVACDAPPAELFLRLARKSPAPFAAYLDCGGFQIVSSSPELFLRVADRTAETRPIKGTRPRGANPEDDRARAEELLASPKDRAELVMIVDLERNDLGRVSEYGSVVVPELVRLESYPQVHHLVATVRSRLRPEVGPLECLRALFPGGSITGAPKIRAMEIIDELEPVPRGVYTGAIGWVDALGSGEWSIAIRTMTVQAGQVYLHAGAGIVADSDPELEWQETLAKARGMLQALNADGPGDG